MDVALGIRVPGIGQHDEGVIAWEIFLLDGWTKATARTPKGKAVFKGLNGVEPGLSEDDLQREH